MRSASAAFFMLLFGISAVRAEGKTDPLRLVPPQAELVVQIDSPRALVEKIYGHDVVRELLKIDAVAALFDSTKVRHLLQLMGYFEKNLGHERNELLDRLAGGGVVLAGHFSGKEPALLLVVQAKDDKLLNRFVQLARKVLDQELARQEAKEKVRLARYRQVETMSLGTQFHVAQVGGALLFSNAAAALKDAIDLYLDGDKNSIRHLAGFMEARKQLPGAPLVWTWGNLEPLHKNSNFKNGLDAIRLNPVTLAIVGGVADVLQRSPYVCAALTMEGKNLHARVVLPRGKSGMSPHLAAMFLPEDGRGSLPMLEPPRVLSCTSYYFDLSKLWDNRATILGKDATGKLDEFEKQAGKYLGTLKLSTLFKQVGRYHRIVTVQPEKSPYKIQPAVPTSAYAVVLDMRDPAFAKSMGTILRAAALAGTFQYGLRLSEEKHGEHNLVAYYFPENRKVEGDQFNVRFNFSPCFSQVGNQFVISSTVELGRDLIDCLVKENLKESSPVSNRTQLYATGLAANLRANQDQLLTQAILSQALPAKAAKKQLDDVLRLVERSGHWQFEVRYGQNEFRFDARWNYERK